MATKVLPNPEYKNGETVNTKYNPFAPGLRLAEADKALYGKMLTNRTALLKSMNLMPRTLQLVCRDWAVIERAEVDKKPPLVVISSNRANWIKDGVAAADAELKKRDLDYFTSVNDFRALRATNGQTVSPPIYCPSRLGADPQRSVFIVVHRSEYGKYKTALANSGMNVIGWGFEGPDESPPFVGFGASRFAAIEFCKTLRAKVNDLGKVWDYAWLIDDNVVALENFAGLESVEAALAQKVCAAFKGANCPSPFTKIKSWALAVGPPPNKLPPSNSYGVLQQVGLWNIKLLADQFLNFPPTFLTSAEDLSLTRYFTYQGIQYLVYDVIPTSARQPRPILVVKETAKLDDDGGGEVNKARQYYAALFAKTESGLPQAKPVPPAPPPPVNVECKTVAKTVVEFVNTDLFPPPKATKDPKTPETRKNTAACQGVEQIAKTAIGLGRPYIDEAPLTRTFQINGKADHSTEFYPEKEFYREKKEEKTAT